jgi:LytS/YehU family sensor histidine kinase
VYLIAKIPTAHAIYYSLNKFSGDSKLRSKFLLIALLFLAAGLVIYLPLVSEIIYPYIFKQQMPIEYDHIMNRLMNAFMDMIFGIGLGYAFQQYNLEKDWRRKEKVLVEEKLLTELKFLKAQINPHFLFNTLNNIYGLTRKNSAHASEAVLKLSEMLRYMLYETSADRVAIEKEIELIDNYIDIEKLRYSDRLKVIFEKRIDNPKAKIAPLLLLHFVENAFKHGPSESRFEAFIHIHLSLAGEKLEFIVVNSKEDTDASFTESIGLTNIRRQLELTYPSHKLDVNVQATEFRTTLALSIHEQ